MDLCQPYLIHPAVNAYWAVGGKMKKSSFFSELKETISEAWADRKARRSFGSSEQKNSPACPKPKIIVVHKSGAAGIAAFVFGLISIFFAAPIFVPRAVLRGLCGLLTGQFAWGCIGLLCAFIGFITSPILMGILGLALIFGNSQPAHQKSPPPPSETIQDSTSANAPSTPSGNELSNPASQQSATTDSGASGNNKESPANAPQPKPSLQLVYSGQWADFFLPSSDIEKDAEAYASSGSFTVELHSVYKGRARANMIKNVKKMLTTGGMKASPEDGSPDLLKDVITTTTYDTRKQTVTLSGKQVYLDTSNRAIGTTNVHQTYPLDSPKYVTLHNIGTSIESLLMTAAGGQENQNEAPVRQGESRARPKTSQASKQQAGALTVSIPSPSAHSRKRAQTFTPQGSMYGGQWSKPGGTQAEIDQDDMTCTTSVHNYIVTHCNNNGCVAPEGFPFTSPALIEIRVYNSCMENLGWNPSTERKLKNGEQRLQQTREQRTERKIIPWNQDDTYPPYSNTLAPP